MKTQISVLVKRQGIFSKNAGHVWWGPFCIFAKDSMILYIDEERHDLPESKTPYVFDVEPGSHVIRFEDPRRGAKEANKAIMDFIDTITFGLLSFGGVATGIVYGFGDETEDGSAQINLAEGDILKLSCKGQGSGVPKIKVLRK